MSTGETFESLGTKADAAFRKAAWTVIERAKQTGTPIIVWQEGRIVERSPDEVAERLRQKEESADPVPRSDEAPPPA